LPFVREPETKRRRRQLSMAASVEVRPVPKRHDDAAVELLSDALAQALFEALRSEGR
jgi:hypothetical protein